MGRRAVLFDLDGTLVDSAPAIAAALSELRVERGSEPLAPALVRPWISFGAPDLVRLGLAETGRAPEEDLAAFRARLREMPTPLDSLYPGVREMAQALERAGMALAVVTNKPEGLAKKLLEDLKLASLFAVVVGGDTAALPKPDPAPLQLALERIHATSANAVFVGDSAVDADAAAALCLPFLLYEGGYGADECEGRCVAMRFTDHAALAAWLLNSPQAAA